MNIGSGVVVTGGASSQIVVRDTLTIADAVLTSAAANPAPGDWLGVLVYGSATGTRFTGSAISYAGSNAGAALDVLGASPAITGVEIRESRGRGLRVSDGAAPAITDSVITANPVGLESSSGAGPTIRNSFMAGNLFGVRNLDLSRTVSALNNWWGDPSGPLDASNDTASGGSYNPSGLGVPVSDGIGYTPWSTVIPILGASFTIAQGSVTETPGVLLNLSCRTCTEFRVSETASFSGASFSPLAPTFPFTISAPDALKTVYVQFRAATGNTATVSRQIRLDTAGPTLTVTTPAAGSSVGRPITISAEATDPAGVARVEFFVDGISAGTDTSSPYAYFWDVLAVADGGHEIKVVATDTLGHATTDIRTVTVSKTVPPSPVITSPPAGLINSRTVNVAGTAEPQITVTLYYNGLFAARTTATAAGAFQFTGIPLTEGPAILTATASDPVGTSQHSAPVQLTVDTGPPAAPRLYRAVAETGGGIRLEWTPEINDVPARYRLFRSTAMFSSPAGATLVNGAITSTSYLDIPPADGTYFYGLTAQDAAGNESPLSTLFSATSDRTAPTAGVAFSPVSPVGPGTVAVTLTVSEPLVAPPYLGIAPAGDVAMGVDLVKVTDTLWTGAYVITGATRHGTATVSFTGKDLVGNKGTTLTAGATMAIDTRGPVGALTFSPPATAFKPGTVSIALTLDEPATGTPTLVCTPPSGVVTPIPLTGGGALWNGSLVITQAMGDGPAPFTLTAQDRFGNSGGSLTTGAVITLDVTPPSAPANLTARSLPAGAVKLNWNAGADAASYRVYRGPSSSLTLPATPLAENLLAGTYQDLPAADGEYRYGVTAVDRAGNESPLSTTVTGLSDRVVPGAPSGLTHSLTGVTVQLSWTAPAGEPVAGYNLYRSLTTITGTAGLTPIKYAPAATVTTDVPPEDGRYFYAVTALDAAGNAGALSNVVDVLYSLSPPLITVTGVTPGQYSPGTVTPVITVKSATPGTQSILLDGVPFVSGTPVTTEGAHLLRVEATDTQSRTSVKEVTFTIDLTDPVIAVSGVTAGAFYETTVIPVITVTDANPGTTTITLNGAPFVSGTPVSTDGVRTLRVEARDLAGRIKVMTVAFTLDVAPPLPATLAVTATQGGSAELSWSASEAGDVAGYHIYKNGVKLTSGPLNALAYTDTQFNGDIVQLYELSAVDSSGHESLRVPASVLPVQVAMKEYGRTYADATKLSKQYIEIFKTDILNKHSEPVTLGSIVHELRDNLSTVAGSTQNGPVTVAAGATLGSEKIMPVGAGIVDFRTYLVTMNLPAPTGVTVKKVALFTLNAFDPGLKVEVFNEPLIKGGMAKVRLKMTNHGSAPIEVLTSSAGQPSAEVSVLLKDQNGNVLAKGNLSQKGGGGVITYSGYSLAEIAPTASFLTVPIDFVVPLTAPDKVYLEATVTNIYHHYKQADQISAGPLSGYANVTVSQAAYSATVTSDSPDYDQNMPVILSGSALDISTGLPVPNVAVKIGIGVKGFDRYLMATTDATGRFTTTFTPLNGEAGNYTLWATHPAVYDKPVQSNFTIYGMTFDPRAINLRMSKNSSFSMPITIRNQGEADLTGIQFSITSVPGITGELDTTGSVNTLAGGKATTVKLTLTAAMAAPDVGSATVTVMTSEGIARTLEVSIALLPALPTITTDPNYIEVGVSRNSSRVVTFKLKNTGYAPLTGIRIEPPATAWMGLASATTLPPLDPGKSVEIGVIFRPTDTVEQGVYTDKLVITSGNHVPYTLNLFATVTSTRTGGVHFQAVDALNTKVAGASVIISHQQLGSVVLSGKTDALGEISFLDIIEGMYNYKVQAPGHEVVVSNFEIKPDVVTPLEVFMNNIFVTYEWSVTPVTFSDKYNITLKATFETQVPAPVLTIDPSYERLELEIGSTYAGEYRVTNHGLVAIDNVKITPAYGPGLRVETLITELPRIGPQETIIVPYRITVNPFKSPEPVDPCSEIPMEINVGGGYFCAFGTLVGTGVTGTKTIIPKERYDLLGLCDLKCDWCDCLPGTAGSLCKCLKNGDMCECAGLLFGGDTASGLCSCATAGGAGEVANCLLGMGLGAVVPVVGQIMDAWDKIKAGVNCALCLAEFVPPLPPAPPSSVTGVYGGGSYGGMGSVRGGGIGFSGAGCK